MSLERHWMTRRFALVAATFAALAVALVAMAAPAAGAYTPQLKRYPYLTDLVGSSVIVNWATDRSATAGHVKWGRYGSESCTANTAPATRTSISVNGVLQYQWKAKLTLEPNTEYCYRVYLGSSSPVDLLGTDASPRSRTQVASGSSAPYSFAVFGDWGEVLNADGSNPDQANVMSRIAQSGARFAVTTGDNAYGSGSQTNYGDLVQSGPNVSAVFGPSFWKAPGAQIPIFPAMGNHGHSNNVQLVNFPQDTAVATSGGRYQTESYCCLNGTNSANYPSAWYAFDAGNARFYVLEGAWSSSNTGSVSEYQNDYDYHWAPGTPQREWLEDDLASHPRAHKFAFVHYPMYSDNPDETSDPFLQGANSLEGLLASNGVKLSFSGHAHTYQRNLASPLGLVSYLTGGGGAHLQPIGGYGCSPSNAYGLGWSNSSGGSSCGAAPLPSSPAQVHHYLLVTVNGSSVTVTPHDSQGNPFDPVTYTGSTLEADLDVTQSDSPDPVSAGSELTYTLQVANSGPAGANGATLTDELPAGATFVSASPSQGTCSHSSGTVTCSLGTLGSSASATVQIVVRPQSAGQVTNTAFVNAAETDPDTGDNSATQTTTVQPAADLTLTTSDSPDPVSVGADLNYTLSVGNAGPSQATSVTLTDQLPAGTTFVSATPSQGNCSEATGTVTCELGAQAASATSTVQIVVRPQSFGTITNTASVSAAEQDPNAANNSASQTTTVQATADLSIASSDSPDPVGVGSDLTYTLDVANAGPSDATSVTLTDELPDGVELRSTTTSQGTCSSSGGPPSSPLTLTPVADAYVQSAAAGSNAGLSSQLRTDASPDVRSFLRYDLSAVSGQIATARLRVRASTANSVGFDVRPVASDTWGETTITHANAPAAGGVAASSGAVTVGAWAELDVTSLAQTGELVSLAMTSTSSTATSYSSREAGANAPKLELTFVQGSPGVSCQLGPLAALQTATVQVVVRPESPGQVTNTASVAAAQTDPDGSDNSASSTTTVATPADVSLTQTDSPDPVLAGSDLTYTLGVANGGPSSAGSVSVTDNLPAGVTFVSASPSQGTCSQTSGTVSCGLGTLGTSASASVQIVVRPQSTGQITNTASVSAAGLDPNSANNSAAETTSVSPAADLSITNSDSPDPVTAGSNLTYTLGVANAGPSAADSISVTDQLPAGVDYLSATPSQGSCTHLLGMVTCDLGTLGSSQTASIALVVQTHTAGQITNTASVSSAQQDPNAANSTASQTTTVQAAADLSIASSDSPDPVAVGSDLTYTLDVANAGPSDATSVTLTDELPVGAELRSFSPSQGTCSSSNPSSSITLTPVADAYVQSAAAGSNYGLSSQLRTDASPDVRSFLRFDLSAVSGQIADAKLRMRAGSANPTGFDVRSVASNGWGETTITHSNAPAAGAVTASSGAVTTGTWAELNVTSLAQPGALMSVAMTSTSSTATSYSSREAGANAPKLEISFVQQPTLTCQLGTIAASSQASVQVVVRPQATGQVTNTASISSAETDPDGSDNSASSATTVAIPSDLSLTQSDSPDPVLAGSNLTYTLGVANAGPSWASSVTLTDDLPAGATFVSASPSQGTCNQSAGTVTCDLGTIAVSSQAAVQVVVRPQSAGQITNAASVGAAQPDSDPADNSASETTTVSPAADLSLTSSDSPDPVEAGASLTYTLDVANAGPSSAGSVTVTDALPAGATYLSATPSQGACTHLLGSVTCELGTLASSASASVEIEVVPLATGEITNTASVSSAEQDPNTADNSDSEMTTVQPAADLSVASTSSPAPVAAGSDLTYTLDVSNAGPSDASGVTLTNVLPEGATYLSATPTQGSCSQAAGAVSCQLGALAVSASTSVEIVVRPQAAGQAINTASVSAVELDPDAANNVVSLATTVDPVAGLSLAMSDSEDPVHEGSDLTYTLDVSNAGPSDATSVTLTDQLPGGATFVSATPTQGSCSESSGTVTCDLGALNESSSASVQIVVQPEGAGEITNTASVSANEHDSNPGDNAASQTTTVDPVADLGLSMLDGPDPVAAGSNLTYTLEVANAGPSDADSVTLTDELPSSVTYVSATPSQGSCSEASAVVTCDLGALAASLSATVEIVVEPQDVGEITNSASLSAGEHDPVTANNSASESTTVQAAADPIAALTLTTTDAPDPVRVGGELTYTLDVANAGPSDATVVTLIDELPAGVTYLSATPSQGSCDEASGTVTCDLGTLASSSAAAVQIVVLPQSAGELTNSASVSATEDDPELADNSASDTTTVEPVADLSLAQADSPDPVVTGAELTYTLDVANAGPSEATSVTLTDDLPAGVTFLSATSSQGSCSESSGIVTCDLGTLAASSSATVQIVVLPNGAGDITNSASISVSEHDPDDANNAADEGTTVLPS